MIKTLIRVISPEDWKRAIAFVILWAYAYQLVVWPAVFWGLNIVSWWLDLNPPIPVPVIVPWEQLIAGTTTLAAVGGIETWREQNRAALHKDAT